MLSHAAYVALSYAITALAVGGLAGWILLDQRNRRAELAELEARGIRRRSAQRPSPETETAA